MAARAKTEPIVIWGARGHALVLVDLLGHAGYHVVAFFDNDPQTTSPIPGVPIHHGSAGLRRWLTAAGRRSRPRFAIAIGGDRGRDRLAIHATLTDAGLRPATLVHRSAVVAATAALGDGVQILAAAVVGPGSVLGAQTIVNTAASVDHECELGPGVHVGPGAVLAGCVRVGACAFVGAGAVVLPRLAIGDEACVGAGAVVIRDVAARATVAGNPAKPLRRASARGTRLR